MILFPFSPLSSFFSFRIPRPLRAALLGALGLFAWFPGGADTLNGQEPDVSVPRRSPREQYVSPDLVEPAAPEARKPSAQTPPRLPPALETIPPLSPAPALPEETLRPAPERAALTAESEAEAGAGTSDVSTVPAVTTISTMTRRLSSETSGAAREAPPPSRAPPAQRIEPSPGASARTPPPASEPPAPARQDPARTPPPAAAPPASAPPQSSAPPPAPAFIQVAEEVPPSAAAREIPVRPDPLPPARIAPRMLEPQETALFGSRTLWAFAGKSLEIPFQGSGWSYLGEKANRKGMDYRSRRNDSGGQTYIFQAEKAGTYTLSFSKQNFIEDYTVHEEVTVIVSENPSAAAPQTGSVAGSAQRALPEDPPANSVAAPQNARTQDAGAALRGARDADTGTDYVREARDAYGAGAFPKAVSLLDTFRERFPEGTDEAWWLYGQSLEANSPSRDIRSALDYYRRLLKEYPQSPHGEDARRRIAYLERYYFNIR